MAINIGVIQFPGSNTERETGLAIKRSNMNPVEVMWNADSQTVQSCDGFIITGGFSFEDRSRAGVVASLDPIMDILKEEAAKGKPVFGICNGAQILVESGLVPGVEKNQTSIALTDNKRIQNGHVVGTGYYNTWTHLKVSVPPESTAFTRHLNSKEIIYIPFAHAEGRFIVPDKLLNELINNNQSVFRYCDDSGEISSQFPTNPNGSDYNLAAVSNPSGNVLAMMPHPERTNLGDKLFSSMREFIEHGTPMKNNKISYVPEKNTIDYYTPGNMAFEWVIDMVITDNEEATVQNALQRIGLDVTITRQQHWEITTSGDSKNSLKKIEDTGELFNSNKEYISAITEKKDSVSFLVRQKEDMHSQAKFESIRERFSINELVKLKRGVIWNISIKSTNFESVLNSIIDTNILFNPLSHECFRIS
ncbi:MAG: phosphoribosylformylglycinamidine synthase I [Candidatus Marinimicrobia bacterium]|nr:phosphoribosylformylglycinamidine synthase I [Candidatus Neomarinimicrobiota bacterium]